MFEKNLGMGLLLDFYGDLLPEKRRTVMDYYYNDDLSLAEIADEIGISRQGVREQIGGRACLLRRKAGACRPLFRDGDTHHPRACTLQRLSGIA